MEENRIGMAEESAFSQYIVVKIGNEQYGINIKYIDNIVRMQKITRVPKTQVYYRGVINLRGEVIPVMSLRLKLALESDQFDNKTRIIIVKMDNATIGIIVDEVREVVSLDEDSIEMVVYNPADERTNYISGIGKNNGELISLLDMNAVLSEKENA
ncbi:MAG: chemotaxis protein CheW [Thermoflexaceae bacterium]|nr:chemotaxis protein CheW [Thermoflexaceae bacterium]